MDQSPPSAPTKSDASGFSILGWIIRLVVILCVGSFLLMVAGFLGLLFFIVLHLGFQIVMIVVGIVILIFTGGS